MRLTLRTSTKESRAKAQQIQKGITEQDWMVIDQHLKLNYSPEQTSRYVLDNYIIRVSPENIYQHILQDKRRCSDLHDHFRRKKKYRKRSQQYDN